MVDRQKYSEYLGKKKNKKISEQRLCFFDALERTFARDEIDALSNLCEKNISDFIKSFEWSLVKVQKAFDFMSDYVSFIQKEQPELNSLADLINQYCLKTFEASGIEAASIRKKTILLIPDDVVVEPKHLGDLTNAQFVSAFRELQKLVIKIYDDVETSPFEWGYPDFYTTDGYYNRVIDFLFALVSCGVYKDGTITVDTKRFMNFTRIKKHKKPEFMISGFKKMRFDIDGFDKKSISFHVKYPAHSHIIFVLYAYVRELGDSVLHWSAREMMKWSLSYRFIEDPVEQKYEAVFHSKMDVSSEELRNFQHWLHGEADKYGYKIDVSHPYEKGCIQYKKGSKVFLLVGEKKIDGIYTIFSKVIFREAFSNENEKIMQLHGKFPDTFKSNCTLCNGSKSSDSKCSMRICYDIEGKPRRNCAYLSFYFQMLTLEDVKEILELFIIENINI